MLNNEKIKYSSIVKYNPSKTKINGNSREINHTLIIVLNSEIQNILSQANY